ncbi:MAG: glycosyltransferase [Endomicrobia bacterium]|nr:glycosyltransferase [Endomicrobiia bacterium]
MNIIIFDAQKYWSGGAERVYYCCKLLKEKKHNIVLVCLRTSRLNNLLKKDIKIYNCHPIFDFDFLAIIKIGYILLKHKIQILDIHSPKFYWIAAVLGKIFNKKVCITRNVEYRKFGIKRLINKILYSHLCDKVVVVSKKVYKILIKDFKLETKKLKIIYDGFYIPASLKNIRDFYNIKEEGIVLSIIGRIERNKSQDFAVDVTYNLLKKGYNIYLFVIGPVEQKDYYSYIIKKIKNYKIENKVIFTGFVENIYDYISSSQIVLCCSEYESMGKVVVESLIIGVPVVSSYSVKVDEILNKEYLSRLYLVDKNIDSFVEKIENIIEHKPIYNLPKKFLYTYKEMVENYINCYKEMLVYEIN